ncbi:hypothetical protein GLYMA_01G102802v4 [Glycine max]|nr:hypothetical protein GLYMA_01G102802v4 [Glycine max]KAH1162484.1 hypothetical protein GYH30_001111 [Glycine max]
MIRRHSSASHCRCWRFPCLFGILSSYGLKTSQFWAVQYDQGELHRL